VKSNRDTKDPVRDFLGERGCPDHVISGGLRGLVETWEKIVQAVKEGYTFGLDDYLNDLDTRQLLEETLAVASREQKEELLKRVRQADELMKSLVKPSGKCLWGEDIAETEGWTAGENWWYFSHPIRANPELLSEIEER
jgi:hypothetical protein